MTITERSSKDRITNNLLASLVAMSEYVTFEVDDEGVIMHVQSEFLEDDNQEFIGRDVNDVVMKAAQKWRDQCKQQGEILEAQMNGYMMWKTRKNLVEESK